MILSFLHLLFLQPLNEDALSPLQALCLFYFFIFADLIANGL